MLDARETVRDGRRIDSTTRPYQIIVKLQKFANRGPSDECDHTNVPLGTSTSCVVMAQLLANSQQKPPSQHHIHFGFSGNLLQIQ